MITIASTARIIHKELTIENSLVSGLFYYTSEVFSKKIGAEILFAYGLLVTGAGRLQERRFTSGFILSAMGSYFLVDAIASIILHSKHQEPS